MSVCNRNIAAESKAEGGKIMQDNTRSDNKTPVNIPKKSPPDRSNITDVPRGDQLRSELDSISSRIKKLESALALPVVKEDGSSECYFAENLYAKKEGLEKQVASDVEKLKPYVMALGKEEQRCKGNLQQIQTDGGRLNVPETSQRYSEAAEAQQRQLQSAIDDKAAVCVVLAKAQAVLKASQAKKFPGRKPQEQPLFPVPPLSGPGLTCVQPSPGQPDNELGGLVSLGPLGKTENRQD